MPKWKSQKLRRDAAGQHGRAGSAKAPHARSQGHPHPSPHGVFADVRVVGIFGDTRLRNRADLKGSQLLQRPESMRPGARPLMVEWCLPEGVGTSGLFTGACETQWAQMITTVAEMKRRKEPMDYALVNFSSLALFENRSEGILRADFRECARRVSSGLDNFLGVMRTLMPNVCIVVLGVMPEKNWSLETAAACRELAASLREVARQKGALFIDIEAVLRPVFDVPPPGVRLGDASGTQPTVSHGRPAQPPRLAPPGGGVVTEARLEQMREELRRELYQELRRDLLAELRQELQLKDEHEKFEPKAEPEDTQPSDPQTFNVHAEPEDAAPSSTSWNAGEAPTMVAELKTFAAFAQGCSEGGVPWVSGWVPGRPPPVHISAPLLPSMAYDPERKFQLTREAYNVIKSEILRVILSFSAVQ